MAVLKSMQTIHPEVMHFLLTVLMSKSTNRREADQETSNKRLYMCL